MSEIPGWFRVFISPEAESACPGFLFGPGVVFSIDGALVAYVFFVMPGIAGASLLENDVLPFKEEFAEFSLVLVAFFGFNCHGAQKDDLPEIVHLQ